jgi:hypothetical protein
LELLFQKSAELFLWLHVVCQTWWLDRLNMKFAYADPKYTALQIW